jgi:hypothetical protein
MLSPAFLERRWKPGQSGNPSGHAARTSVLQRSPVVQFSIALSANPKPTLLKRKIA